MGTNTVKKLGETSIPLPILKIARRIRRWVLKENGNSEGMCSGAATCLIRYLKSAGYRAYFINGWFKCELPKPHREQHCFVRIGRRILDVTADQFNFTLNGIEMRAIVYGTPRQLKYVYLYKNGKKVK